MAPLACSTDREAATDMGVAISDSFILSYSSTLLCRYKILFLDVLFPLNVKKIIFVDADQVM